MGAGASAASDEEQKTRETLIADLRKHFQDLQDEVKADLVLPVEGIIQETVSRTIPTKLSITVQKAFRLRDADKVGLSDPYVCVDVGEQSERTKTVTGSLNPVWNETFEFSAKIGDTIKLSLFDEDNFKDETLGNINLPISAHGDFIEQHVLSESSGAMTFSYYLEAHDFLPDLQSMSDYGSVEKAVLEIYTKVAALDQKAADDMADGIAFSVKTAMERQAEIEAANRCVVRKEIRSLPVEEQERVLNAIHKLMENKDGPETSEYWRLAGYHGYPEDYCTHRQENFPVWHRAYLIEFERCLQAADKELGNDGRLALPYWDFGTTEVNGEVAPSIVRKMKLPEDFFKPGREHKLAERGYKLNDDDKVRLNLEQCKMRELLDACLEETVHWRHASMESNAGTSIENPHNMAHMSLGFPVSNLGFASFHPVFFMLHANVDRYYEQYLRLEPDSKKEFETHQAQRVEKGDENRFLNQLTPFVDRLKKTSAPAEAAEAEAKSNEETVYCPNDMFLDTDTHNYTYDKLPVRRPPQMREAPLYVVFEKFDPVFHMIDKDNNMKDLLLHIFLFDKTQFPAPEVQAALIPLDAELSSESNVAGQLVYAGWTAALASKGPQCKNCQTTPPVTLTLNVTKAAAELGISRGLIGIKVMCLDDEGQVCTAERVTEVHGEKVVLPLPKLLGPMFDANALSDAVLCKDTATKDQEDQVERLKDLLTRLGFYKGEVDGVFTEELEESLKRYQRFTGIADDGKLGVVTKNVMLSVRNDAHSDVYDGSDNDDTPFKESPTFAKASTIKWWLGTCPGYLDASKVQEEVTTATGTWATVLDGSVTFERVESAEGADISITWEDNQKDKPLTFDGKGGAIAHATPKGVALDSNERWRLSGTTRKRADEYAILPVLLHELGHSLGLQAHSRDPISIMAPYYLDNRVQLSEADVARAKALYE